MEHILYNTSIRYVYIYYIHVPKTCNPHKAMSVIAGTLLFEA